MEKETFYDSEARYWNSGDARARMDDDKARAYILNCVDWCSRHLVKLHPELTEAVNALRFTETREPSSAGLTLTDEGTVRYNARAELNRMIAQENGWAKVLPLDMLRELIHIARQVKEVRK